MGWMVLKRTNLEKYSHINCSLWWVYVKMFTCTFFSVVSWISIKSCSSRKEQPEWLYHWPCLSSGSMQGFSNNGSTSKRVGSCSVLHLHRYQSRAHVGFDTLTRRSVESSPDWKGPSCYQGRVPSWGSGCWRRNAFEDFLSYHAVNEFVADHIS